VTSVDVAGLSLYTFSRLYNDWNDRVVVISLEELGECMDSVVFQDKGFTVDMLALETNALVHKNKQNIPVGREKFSGDENRVAITIHQKNVLTAASSV
jgi:hypothetical protein